MKHPPPIGEFRRICQSEVDDAERTIVKRKSRAILIYPTWLFLHTPISANQVTLLHGLVYLGGAALLIAKQPLIVLIGLLLIRISGLFDVIDGMIARYRGTVSQEGGFLDDLMGFLGISLFMCLSFGIYRGIPEVPVILFGVVATLAYTVRVLLVHIPNTMLLSELTHDSGLGKSPAQHYKMGRFSGFIARAYAPSRRLPRLLGIFVHHFTVVNCLIIAAVIDVFLNRGLPMAAVQFNALYVILAIYAILASIDAICRVNYLMQTRDIQRRYSELADKLR